MTREKLFKELDALLSELGFADQIAQKWGSITFQINFQAGKEVLSVIERETRKPVAEAK